MTAESLGDDLGHHELLRVVGGGVRGLVYEAFDPRVGRRVAIKTFRLDALGPQAAATFEARLRAGVAKAATLQHPNIVAVHGCDRQGPTASLAMEFVDGETLAQHLVRVGKLPALQALALVAQLLSALEMAHGHGLAHGRITPEHLLVSRTGQLKVAGFGIPLEAEATVAGDLFGAAAVAWEMLTGMPTLIRPGATDVPTPDLPPAVAAVLERALANDPALRYQSAGELFAALRTAFDPPLWVRPDKPSHAVAVAEPHLPRETTPVVAVPMAAARVPAARRPGPASRAVRKRVALAGACAVGVAAVVGLLLLGELGPPQRKAAASQPIPVAAAPVNSLPAPSVAPAAPVLVAEEKPPSIAAEPRQPEPEPAAPIVKPEALQAEPAPAEAGTVRAPSQPSVRRADNTHFAGAGPAARQPQASRRRASFTERQLARSGPDATCGHHQMTIAREICRVAECATAELRTHPVCVRLHAEQRRRDQLNEQALRTR